MNDLVPFLEFEYPPDWQIERRGGEIHGPVITVQTVGVGRSVILRDQDAVESPQPSNDTRDGFGGLVLKHILQYDQVRIWELRLHGVQNFEADLIFSVDPVVGFNQCSHDVDAVVPGSRPVNQP